MEITVSLKNPPPGANGWVFGVQSHDEAHYLDSAYTAIDEAITLQVPADWFPLYSSIPIFTAPYTKPIHEITNYPSLSWWSGYDASLPLITEPGSYYYNVATKQFELIEPPEVVPCEITITAPDSAAEGEKVSVSALLKNVSSYGSMYKTEISAVPDLFPAFRIGTIEKYIDSGESFTAYGSFTMPASNVTILIWVERWAVDHWVYDNSASRVVSLEIVPEYKGTISKKELEYDDTRKIIPVY